VLIDGDQLTPLVIRHRVECRIEETLSMLPALTAVINAFATSAKISQHPLCALQPGAPCRRH
jgi:hypothetical protein